MPVPRRSSHCAVSPTGYGKCRWTTSGRSRSSRQGSADGQRRRCDGCQPAGPHDAHAVLHCLGRFEPGRVRHQRGHIVPACRLSLGQQLHVVLDAAQDGGIVLVDVEYLSRRHLPVDCPALPRPSSPRRTGRPAPTLVRAAPDRNASSSRQPLPTQRQSRAMSAGSIKSAASPATSGSAETFEQITGVPQAIASSTGRPKPSNRLGKTKTSAAPYSAGRSSSAHAADPANRLVAGLRSARRRRSDTGRPTRPRSPARSAVRRPAAAMPAPARPGFCAACCCQGTGRTARAGDTSARTAAIASRGCGPKGRGPPPSGMAVMRSGGTPNSAMKSCRAFSVMAMTWRAAASGKPGRQPEQQPRASAAELGIAQRDDVVDGQHRRRGRAGMA